MSGIKFIGKDPSGLAKAVKTDIDGNIVVSKKGIKMAITSGLEFRDDQRKSIPGLTSSILGDIDDFELYFTDTHTSGTNYSIDMAFSFEGFSIFDTEGVSYSWRVRDTGTNGAMNFRTILRGRPNRAFENARVRMSLTEMLRACDFVFYKQSTVLQGVVADKERFIEYIKKALMDSDLPVLPIDIRYLTAPTEGNLKIEFRGRI